MNAHVGHQVLLRSAVAALVVTLLLGFVLATRLMLSGVPPTPTVLGLLCVLQFPLVAVFACGLGTYWLVDDWVRSDAWALMSAAGFSGRRIAAAAVAPGLVVALWMLLFNVTVFRKASLDGTRAVASVQLEDAGRAMARAGVLQLGRLRLLARRAEGPALHGALSSFDTLALEATEARFAGDTLVAEGVTLLMLEEQVRYTAASARLRLPEATPWTWGARLRSDRRGMTKGLALALSIPASMLSAVRCASLGRRLGRRGAFGLWAVLGVGALVGVNLALATSGWWAFQPLWPLAAFLLWAVGSERARAS